MVGARVCVRARESVGIVGTDPKDQHRMGKAIIIAEKPSVAQDIVRALTPTAGKFEKHADHFENDQYVVTSAVGHLVEIKAPEEFDVKRGKWSFANLPVVPPRFDLAPIDKARTRLNAVVKLCKRKDVDQMINACDAGREGELIFRLIEQYAAGAKGTLGKPVRRLWLQSMTPQAIRDGFEQLRSDAQMQGLADAARSRSEADWLVGINGTRAMTAFNSRDGGFFLTTVGRVQTPTLSIVVEREEKIRKHVARDYWEVRATFAAQAGRIRGQVVRPGVEEEQVRGRGPGRPGPRRRTRADRLWTAADAQAIAKACRGEPASVSEEAKPSTQASPLLYDLTTLQREANGRFGFSAKTTLSLAQALYEKHKVLTYPRTDSRPCPRTIWARSSRPSACWPTRTCPGPMRDCRPARAQGAQGGLRQAHQARVRQRQGVGPLRHHPDAAGAQVADRARAKLYDMVVKRFLAVFYPSAEYLVTTRISRSRPRPPSTHHFQTNGKVLVNPGWLAVYGKEAQDEDANLVPVAPGEVVRAEAWTSRRCRRGRRRATPRPRCSARWKARAS
jgi:DNA topoisomerase-3